MSIDERVSAKVADIEEQISLIESGAQVVMVAGGTGEPLSLSDMVAFQNARIAVLEGLRGRSVGEVLEEARVALQAFLDAPTPSSRSAVELVSYVAGAANLEELMYLIQENI